MRIIFRLIHTEQKRLWKRFFPDVSSYWKSILFMKSFSHSVSVRVNNTLAIAVSLLAGPSFPCHLPCIHAPLPGSATVNFFLFCFVMWKSVCALLIYHYKLPVCRERVTNVRYTGLYTPECASERWIARATTGFCPPFFINACIIWLTVWTLFTRSVSFVVKRSSDWRKLQMHRVISSPLAFVSPLT